MTVPLVALACTTENLDGVAHAAVRRVYVSALEEVAGCAVALLPGPTRHLETVLARFDGLVVGGHESNVAPERYGAPRARGRRDHDRDELALSALRVALAAGLPVLGICRGLQELNTAYGGTLRDLPDPPDGSGHRENTALPRDQQYLARHELEISPHGLLHRITGSGTAWVNSLHGQAVDRLATGLRKEAHTADGVVEAVSVPGAAAFALAVQWHPEWYASTDPVSARLFAAFGAAAAHHAERRGSEA